nr:MAG TPA: hypothetical protein [Bacteriophage sp.]
MTVFLLNNYRQDLAAHFLYRPFNQALSPT